MLKRTFVEDVFKQIATDDCIGNPAGEPAYCYLRVSSSDQAEEGRSGLPRQIMHVHDAATIHGLKIPWSLVFVDDHTGFQFRDRPELTRLRQEFKQRDRRAHTVVIEYLDRLSRNADWHQEFLLDEMGEYGLKIIFWKAFSSQIERVVMGAISQEGMVQEIQRMAEGTLYKAQSGRVTARTRAYGFIFVDAEGKPSPKAKKETYYTHHPDEAEVIKLIYHKVGIEGMSTRLLANYLEGRITPPGKYTHWEPRQIALFIRNPVYKGEFIAHRYMEVRVPKRNQRPNEPMKFVVKKVERPQEEWITVSVPPMVSEELWDQANQMLTKNFERARRDGKNPFLLTGLIKCAICGYSFVGGSKRYKKLDGNVTISQNYRCTSRCTRVNARMQEIGCTQGQIHSAVLEDAIWNCVCKVLLEPDLLLQYIDKKYYSDDNMGLNNQIKFLKGQIKEKEIEDEKLYRAYMADVFDEREYAQRRELLKTSRCKLEHEIAQLEKQQISKVQTEYLREMVLSLANQTAQEGAALNAPFETKQKVIQLVVNKIILHIAEQWFRIEGNLPGFLVNGSFGKS